jgi:hypothetical protein
MIVPTIYHKTYCNKIKHKDAFCKRFFCSPTFKLMQPNLNRLADEASEGISPGHGQRKNWGGQPFWVHDKFMGKYFKLRPVVPKNPPNDY